ncbi:DUF6461 domain-containing protein [Nonomuraea sp. NPDC050663]|uniref:DUF6461 domain-containing protein n=1 Tax=Nonomuraea sp. NPDC050663 TaxID=3364370 RepID=UPI0037B53FF8
MTISPPDASWLFNEYAGHHYSFVYARSTPEDVITRLGGQWATFEPGGFPGVDALMAGRESRIGVTAIGDWTLVIDGASISVYDEKVIQLSEGTQAVLQLVIDVEAIDLFRWYVDGRARYCFGDDEAFLVGTPPELVEPLAGVQRHFPALDLKEGGGFMLVEHLTGIAVTERLLEDSSYLWGRLPGH